MAPSLGPLDHSRSALAAHPNLAPGAPLRLVLALVAAPLLVGAAIGVYAWIVFALHVGAYPNPTELPISEGWNMAVAAWAALLPLTLLVGGPLAALLWLRRWQSTSLYLLIGLLVGAVGALAQQISSGMDLSLEWLGFLGAGAATLMLVRRLAGLRPDPGAT